VVLMMAIYLIGVLLKVVEGKPNISQKLFHYRITYLIIES
jgi:hypothetical protein